VKAVQEAAIREGAPDFYAPESLEVWVGAFSVENLPKRVEELSYWVAELPDGRIAGYLSVRIEIAREGGLDAVWLDASLNAVSFYENGWRETKMHTRVRNGVEIPVVMMEKDLA